MVVLARPDAAAPEASKPEPPAQIHLVTFNYNYFAEAWIGRCTCGWEFIGDKLEAELRASIHDLQPGETI